jgi:hypothetical protein
LILVKIGRAPPCEDIYMVARNETAHAPHPEHASRRGGKAGRRKGNGHTQLSRGELEQMLLGAAYARATRSRAKERQ